MWLSQALWKLSGFISVYVRNFRDAGFDLLRAIAMTKPQLGRLYWVNLVLCAFAFFYLFEESQWLRKAETLNADHCYPNNSLPILALFILAEVASFILLIGAHCEVWLLR